MTYEIGHCLSNEPGYYEEGAFGIRIENVMAVIEKQKGFLGFINMTLVPYCRKLFDFTLLNSSDIQYINKYHQRVWKEVSPFLIE